MVWLAEFQFLLSNSIQSDNWILVNWMLPCGLIVHTVLDQENASVLSAFTFQKRHSIVLTIPVIHLLVVVS